MKCIIVGAGAIGLHLAKTLSWEGHEVVLIDHSQELIDRAIESMDVMAIRGSGTTVKFLREAGAEHADLLIAVTAVDEVNIVACLLAKHIGVRTRIARVRNQEYMNPETPVSLSDLGIDQIITPELEAARTVARMIRYQHAVDMVECDNGKLFLVGFNIDENAPIIGIPLEKLTPNYPELSFRVVAISRGGSTIIPSGFDTLQNGDRVYVITRSEDVHEVFAVAGKSREVSRNIMLHGGGMIGRIVAEELELDKIYNVKLIEPDTDRSVRAVQRLHSTMVIRGAEGIDVDTFALEGLADMDVFAALTDDDENNIVTSLFARHLKVKRTITLINKSEYMPIARAIGLGFAVNELLLTTDAILKYIKGGRIVQVTTLRGIEAEVIEFETGRKSNIAGKSLRDIDFPPGALVGAIDHAGEVKVAIGSSIIEAGDRVVMFCDRKAAPKLEKLFT